MNEKLARNGWQWDHGPVRTVSPLPLPLIKLVARLQNGCIYSVSNYTTHSIDYVIRNPPDTDVATPLATPNCCS